LTRQKSTAPSASDPLVDDSDEEDGESKAKAVEEPVAPIQAIEQDSQEQEQEQQQDPQQEVVVQAPQPVVQEKKKISKRK
jgi:hypothetical protein